MSSNKNIIQQITKLFPWVKYQPSLLQYVFPLKQSVEKLNLIREEIAEHILCTHRAFIAQSWNYALALNEKTAQQLMTSSEDKTDSFEQRVIQCLKAKQQMPETLLDESLKQIPAGFVYDFYLAFEFVCSLHYNRSLPKKEIESWLILIAAALQRYVPNQQILFQALLRDGILYTYFTDDQQTQRAPKFLSLLHNPKQLEAFQKVRHWDHTQFCQLPLCGLVRQTLLNSDQQMEDFILNDHIFSFLFDPKNAFNQALNIISLTVEKPYWSLSKNDLTFEHALWDQADIQKPQQGHQIFRSWLESTIGTSDKEDVLDFVENIVSSGQVYELGEVTKYWSSLSHRQQKKLIKYLEKHELEDNQAHVLRLQLFMNDPALQPQIQKVNFSTLDYLNAILFLRNAVLAGLASLDEVQTQIEAYNRLILSNLTSWDMLFQQVNLSSMLMRIKDHDGFLRISAWYDYIKLEPTALFTAVPFDELSHNKVKPPSKVQNLLARKAIVSLDKNYYYPDKHLWAINVAAPLNGVRSGYLTKEIAPHSLRSENVMFLRYSLNIYDQGDLQQRLDWLQEEGYRYTLQNLINEYSNYSEEDLDQEIISAKVMAGIPKGELKQRINQLIMLKDNAESVLQCQFWALDIIRYSALVQRGLIADLISKDEASYMLHDAACAYQQKYDSWHMATWDFYRAWLFSMGISPASTEAQNRRRVVEGLTNPLHPLSVIYQQIPWDMPLDMPQNEIFTEMLDGEESNFTAQPRTLN